MNRSSYDLITTQIRNRLADADLAVKHDSKELLNNSLAHSLALLWMLAREIDPTIILESSKYIKPGKNDTPIPLWPTDLTGVQLPETD
jgi:hypothetical protein